MTQIFTELTGFILLIIIILSCEEAVIKLFIFLFIVLTCINLIVFLGGLE